MTFTIPILVEERPQPGTRLTTFVVRPLFQAAPIQRAERLNRALNKLTSDLHEVLTNLGRSPRHDALAEWTFNPPLEETTLDLRLELNSGSHKARIFLASYAALDRKLCFAPALSDLHFEVLPAQSLAERATAALTRHLRAQEAEGAFHLEALTRAGRMRLTTLDIVIQPAALAKSPKKPTRTPIFGDTEKKEGGQELRKIGRPLHLLYPDDLDHAVSRDREVEELARLLAGYDRRPILLVGPRKVGKTAIVHEVVRRICARKPERYAGGRQVWLVAPPRLISGMSVLGEWENRTLSILNHAQAEDRVLYFDDLLGLFTAGVSSASNLNVAQVLKPALAKRSVRFIGEITPESWRVLREKDRAFADLWHIIPVAELAEAETLRVLVSVGRELEERHRCEFSIGVAPLVYDLHRRFGGDAAFPGKAVGFLRRLAVRFSGGKAEEAGALDEFRQQSGVHPAVLKGQVGVTRQTIVESLRAGVVGQDGALEAFADVLVKLQARLHDPRRPLGTFLLLGPTGVGKTQAAKSLAAYLFGHPDRLLRFDMNEYVDAAAAPRLTGTPQEPDGLLTSAIRRQPFSVVLFDEVEKAAPEVFDLLLTMLDEGRLTDALGRVADFTQAIIILTSNLGAREARSRLGFAAPGATADADEVFVSAAEKFFRPEFFNRLDRVIPFRALAPAQLERIAQQLIAEVFGREGMRRRECLLRVLPAALQRLVELGRHPQLGARALKRVIEKEVAQPMARRLAALPPGTPTLVSFDAAEDQFVLRLAELRPAPRAVSWGERAAVPRAEHEHRNWLETVLDGTRRFLVRIERDLQAGAPADRVEIGRVPPEQARYFFCREQWEKVGRLVQAAERSLEGPQRATGAPQVRRAPSGKISTRREWAVAHRLRDATTLKTDLAEYEAGAPVEAPDLPVSALLREVALLEMMLARPRDDRPAALVLHALSAADAASLRRLARAYQEGIAGLWGGSAALLLEPLIREDDPSRPVSGVPGPALQAVWCEGLNVSRLLPTGPSSVLVRRADGTLGVVLLSLRRADSEGQMRAALRQDAEQSDDAKTAAEAAEAIGPVIHLLVAGKTLTDFRSGLVIPGDPSAEESRALLLSSLPLPLELRV